MADYLLETERLIMRSWNESDREMFHFLSSDETVMEYFPYRRSRDESDLVMDGFNANIVANGFDFGALALKATDEPIAICGLSRRGLEPFFPPDTVEIGWRMAPAYWGKGYITEAALRLLQFGFEELGLIEVFSFAAHNNLRSIAVMERIGMTHQLERDFDHPAVPDTYRNLKRHVCYRAANPAQ